MLDSVKHNYGLSLVGARVIPNGRHASRFRTDRKQPFILTAGRLWDEGKNVRALIEVAPGLPWPVLLAGQHRNPNGSEAAFLGCTWLGHLTAVDLASWYARAAIYALPARYEPFGLSVLEAALSSCALVLGDIPSLRELWHDAAIFVPPDDPTRLEAALRNLVEDSALRERMAALAVNRARRYSQSRMVTGYLEAYEWARRNGGKRRYACAS